MNDTFEVAREHCSIVSVNSCTDDFVRGNSTRVTISVCNSFPERELSHGGGRKRGRRGRKDCTVVTLVICNMMQMNEVTTHKSNLSKLWHLSKR